MIRLLLPVFLCVLQSRLYAYEPTCDEANPKQCTVYLQKADVTPYAGMLLTVDLAVKLGQKADKCDAVIQIERDYQKQKDDVALNLERQMHQIDTEQAKQSMDAMKKRYEQMIEIPLIERPWIVAGTTVIVTTAAIVLAIWAASKLRVEVVN